MAHDRREMDKQMITIMANHATILANQEYIVTQLTHQHDCMERLKAEIERNSKVIEQLHDLMATFKVTAAISKYVAAISGAGLGLTFTTPNQWQATAFVATPLGNKPTGIDSSDSPRAWLNVARYF